MRWLLFILAFVVRHLNAAEPLSAESLALRILDSEALYTTSDGLKPISDGYWQTRFPASNNTSAEVEEASRLLATLPLGRDLEAGVYVFSSAFDGKRSASAFIAHKPSLNTMITRRADVFAPLGIIPGTAPQQVMEKIDRAPRAARWRAFGLVFGYPEYAVEFFVDAGEKQAETKTFVERDFLQLPTFASSEGRFVYAVPKGHQERDEDRELKTKTTNIFGRYRAWRTAYLCDGKPRSIDLLRAWLAPEVTICRCPLITTNREAWSLRPTLQLAYVP